MNGINPSTGATITNWYQDYCAGKPDKACMVSTTHVPIDKAALTRRCPHSSPSLERRTTPPTPRATRRRLSSRPGSSCRASLPVSSCAHLSLLDRILDCITNTTMLDEFPRLKLIMQFEYAKFETDNAGDQDYRDFRFTNNTAVVNELAVDFASIGTRFSWANSRAAPTSISSAGAPAATNIQGSVRRGTLCVGS